MTFNNCSPSRIRTYISPSRGISFTPIRRLRNVYLIMLYSLDAVPVHFGIHLYKLSFSIMYTLYIMACIPHSEVYNEMSAVIGRSHTNKLIQRNRLSITPSYSICSYCIDHQLSKMVPLILFRLYILLNVKHIATA